MTNIERLPLVAEHAHLEDGRLIFVLRGQDRFWTKEALAVTDDAMTPDAWNEANGISKVEAEAMFAGCVFGWDVPAADPDNWNADGTGVRWPEFPGTVAAVEARKKSPITYSSYRTAYCGYYAEEWRTAAFVCPECAWVGTHDEMAGPNVFDELMDYGCPRCEKMLLIINYPTHEETVEAAARGNRHAEYQLGVMSGEGEHWEDYKRRIEAYNQGLREAWLRFEGPKKYFVRTPEGFVEMDNETASALIAIKSDDA
jgi:hypothetical protein